MENVTKPSLKEKAVNALNTAKTYWQKPAEGKYVSYKEVAFLSGAGFGAHWLTLLATSISLSATNYIVGPSIGLEPVHLQIMLNVANIIGIPIGIFRSWYYDNHHLEGGKFLPFINKSALPIFLLSTLFVWLPYEYMNYITKAVVVEVMYLAISISLSFYTESYSYFQQIITPDSQERSNVMSISQIVYSLAPTISNAALPALAGMTWGRDNIWTYRVIYPCFTVIGLIMSLVFFRKVKERLILPKVKPEPVRMFDAIREVAKNKYYWMIQAAAWIVFLESGYGVILTWSFNYGFDGKYAGAPEGVASLVIGNAALWSMMACPFAIKKFGKRNLLIIINGFNVLAIAALYFAYHNIWLICIITYLNTFISTFWNIVQHNISADMRDYHQWKTGVRVDGLFGPLGMIGTVIGLFTGMFYPYIYESMGLKGDYSVLYDDAIRNNLFETLIFWSAIGAVLNLLPFFFYNLTENKHKGYVEVLKIRAMFINNSVNKLEDSELVDAVRIIRTARELYGKQKLPEDKSAIKAAKRMPKKTEEEKLLRMKAIAEAKAEYNNLVERNLATERAGIVVEELEKFTTKAGLIRISEAEKTVAEGKLCFYKNVSQEMARAKSLPKSTSQEKEIRADAIKLAKLKKQANRLIERFGIENIVLPSESVKEEIQSRETPTFAEAMKVRKELREWAKAVSIYERATKPYTESELLLSQAKDYIHLEELEKRAAALGL